MADGPGQRGTPVNAAIARDLNGDLECADEKMGFISARGTLTNHGAETATYFINVTFHGPDEVRIAEATAATFNLRVGETVAWDATTIARSLPDGWYCEVVDVTRY